MLKYFTKNYWIETVIKSEAPRVVRHIVSAVGLYLAGVELLAPLGEFISANTDSLTKTIVGIILGLIALRSSQKSDEKIKESK